MDERFLRRSEENPSLLRFYLRNYWSILILMVVMVLMFIILSFYKMYYIFDEEGKAPRTVVVEKGMGVRQIAEVLAREGVIDKPWHFIFWVKFKKAESRLKAGRYRLTTDYPIPLVISKMVLGQTDPQEKNVTIPEGLTIREVALILQDRAHLDSARFVGLCRDSGFIASLDVFPEAVSLEGFLFPDTYQIDLTMSAEEVIRIMVRNFKKVFLEEYARIPPLSRLSLYQALVLASIVEKEARRDQERPLIAAVFHNRLQKRIYLESCATVNYVLYHILGQPQRPVLHKKDLQIKSPYNTYIHYGLPPAPICNPGRAAIRATLNPAASEVLYFVSKGDGSHHFSSTLKEHINAKRKYRPFYKEK